MLATWETVDRQDGDDTTGETVDRKPGWLLGKARMGTGETIDRAEA